MALTVWIPSRTSRSIWASSRRRMRGIGSDYHDTGDNAESVIRRAFRLVLPRCPKRVENRVANQRRVFGRACKPVRRRWARVDPDDERGTVAAGRAV